MALWFATGFDEFASPSTYYLNTFGGLVDGSEFSISATGGRLAGKALTNAIAGGGKRFTIIPQWNGHEGICGFAYKFSTGGRANVIARWTATYPDGTTKTVMEMGMDANNILYIDGGDAGIVRGTNPLLAGKFYYLEWKAECSQVTSEVVDVAAPPSQPPAPPYTFYSSHYAFSTVASGKNQVRVNGQLEVNGGSGVWGYTFSGAYIFLRNNVGVGNNSNIPYAMKLGDLSLLYQNSTLQNWFDDFYFLNQTNSDASTTPLCDFLGDVSVQHLQVTTGGTPDAGNDTMALVAGSSKNVACREIEPDGDATYVRANTQGPPALRQGFLFGSIRAGTTSIPGVLLNAVVRKSDIKPWGLTWFMKTGITTLNFTFPTDVPDQYRRLTRASPVAGDLSGWTESNLNALEAGVKASDAANNAALYYQVGYNNHLIPNL